MKTNSTTSRKGRIYDVIFFACLVGVMPLLLPLLGLLGLVFQLAFVVIVPAGFIAAVVYAIVRGRRRRAASLDLVRGVQVPRDVLQSRRHSWVKAVGADSFRIGVDDLLHRVFPALDSVLLPEVGQLIEEGQPLATLVHGQRDLPVGAPLTGVICRINTHLATHPDALKQSPLQRGWLVEMRPLADEPRSSLLAPDEVRAWLEQRIDRLIQLASPSQDAPVMADGGTVTDGFADDLDDEAWDRLRRQLL